MNRPVDAAADDSLTSGVLSILFTDIIGSTRLWSEDEQGMAIDLERHDAIIEAAVRAEGGMVFKHTGDGMGATFLQPAPAVRAGARIQRELGDQPWAVARGLRIRVGVHSGVARSRAGDMFGVAVNRAARLTAICPAGAVLVSEATAALLTSPPAPDLNVVEVGPVQLRDFSRTEIAHTVVGAGLAEVGPADLPQPEQSASGSLPAYEDDVIGRDTEIALLVEEIGRNTLVTVVGTGGLGKTRLAIEAARAAPPQDGTWWCDLAGAASDAAVDAVALASVGAVHQPGRSARDSLSEHLATSRALVILDNCEHVVQGVRDLVTALRTSCPGVHLLCTSREELGLRGERVIRLSELTHADARALFVERVSAVRSDLVWDQDKLAAADAICTHLDCIPLALELAAARCRVMSPQEVEARLDQRFRLLRGGTGGERHRTLEAAVEWSYSLLGPDEQEVFDLMAAFPAGAMLDAVAAVTGRDEFDVADVLGVLVARSMVNVADTALGTRYRQFETMRQFAADRLAEVGREAESREAFVRWAADTADTLGASFLTRDETWAMRVFGAEADNLRAATALAAQIDDLAAVDRILRGLSRWALYRPAYDVLDWVPDHTLLAACGTAISPSTVAAHAELAFLAGQTDRARRLCEAAWAAAPQDTTTTTARAALAIWGDGDPDAADSALAAAVARTDHERFDLAIYRMHVATVRWTLDPATATPAAVEPLVQLGGSLVAGCREAGSTASLAHALAVFGYLQLSVSSFDGSIASAREAAEIARSCEAWFAVNAAQICLVAAFGQVQVRRPEQREAAARELRAVLDTTLAQRNWFFVGALLASAVPLTLWSLGAHREALVVEQVGARHYPGWRSQLPRRARASLDEAELRALADEADGLDLVGAAHKSLGAIDDALAGSPDPGRGSQHGATEV